ncbi:acyl carrier protein [Arenibaculum sp.]|jgi:acyl carrier protein|uniref:acyl carrier protein n=1 Tax=Arenibaculum sp. TaxID=2865862 RepID=UPI002E0E3095|nr:acyl carrier protein [Arenibaculum sp.]
MNQSAAQADAELRTRLCDVLSEVSQGKITVSRAQFQAPLKDLGMDSVTLLSFLVAVEDLVGIEWPADIPKSTFASIDSIADYIDSA